MSHERLHALQRALPLPQTACVDIAVVGGGPAGWICAFLLAQGGARVTLIDQGSKWSSTTELLSGRARRLLEYYASASLARSISGVEVFETISWWHTPTPVGSSMMSNPWGASLAINRQAFDEAGRELARTSGVRILAETRVRSVVRSQGRWHIGLSHGRDAGVVHASLLAIASGRSGLHLLDRGLVTNPSQVALMGRVATGRGEADHRLYVEATTNGWWYAMPDPRGGRFVGFCTGCDEVKRRDEPLYAFWNYQLSHTRLFAPLLADAVLTGALVGRLSGMRSFEKMVGDGWISVGDAAFASDPLSGEGIEFGIESAVYGARSLLAETPLHALREYVDWVREYATRHKQRQASFLRVGVVTSPSLGNHSPEED